MAQWQQVRRLLSGLDPRDARDGKYTDLPQSAPPALVAVVKKAMAPLPADRYVNARQLAGDVESWLKGRLAPGE